MTWNDGIHGLRQSVSLHTAQLRLYVYEQIALGNCLCLLRFAGLYPCRRSAKYEIKMC